MSLVQLKQEEIEAVSGGFLLGGLLYNVIQIKKGIINGILNCKPKLPACPPVKPTCPPVKPACPPVGDTCGGKGNHRPQY